MPATMPVDERRKSFHAGAEDRPRGDSDEDVRPGLAPTDVAGHPDHDQHDASPLESQAATVDRQRSRSEFHVIVCPAWKTSS